MTVYLTFRNIIDIVLHFENSPWILVCVLCRKILLPGIKSQLLVSLIMRKQHNMLTKFLFKSCDKKILLSFVSIYAFVAFKELVLTLQNEQLVNLSIMITVSGKRKSLAYCQGTYQLPVGYKNITLILK